MISLEKEIEILERISRSRSTIRQRDLARIIGLSLGMTNSILKRLAKKGLLQFKKVNNRNIQYLVSPAGMEAITRRSYRYFKRTIRNVVAYKEAMDELVRQIKDKGCTRVLLVGRSDLDFVIEHFCAKYQIDYSNIRKVPADLRRGDGAFLLYSENTERPVAQSGSCASLHSLLVGRVEKVLQGSPG